MMKMRTGSVGGSKQNSRSGRGRLLEKHCEGRQMEKRFKKFKNIKREGVQKTFRGRAERERLHKLRGMRKCAVYKKRTGVDKGTGIGTHPDNDQPS